MRHEDIEDPIKMLVVQDRSKAGRDLGLIARLVRREPTGIGSRTDLRPADTQAPEPFGNRARAPQTQLLAEVAHKDTQNRDHPFEIHDSPPRVV